jgi:hypothetical protein
VIDDDVAAPFAVFGRVFAAPTAAATPISSFTFVEIIVPSKKGPMTATLAIIAGTIAS